MGSIRSGTFRTACSESDLPNGSPVPIASLWKVFGKGEGSGEGVAPFAKGDTPSPESSLSSIPYGVSRLGPRKRNSASLMERPRKSMVSRSIPSPKPPCGGQP